MIITDLKTHLLELDFKIKIGSMPRFKATGLYTNLRTDEGIEGWALSHWNLSNLAQKQFIDEALKKTLSWLKKFIMKSTRILIVLCLAYLLLLQP